jgi:hypothetical protein
MKMHRKHSTKLTVIISLAISFHLQKLAKLNIVDKNLHISSLPLSAGG